MRSGSDAAGLAAGISGARWEKIGWIEPDRAFRALAGPGTAFLDSRGAPGPRSRFSLLGWNPFRHLSVSNGRVTRDGAPVAGDGFAALARELADCQQMPVPGPLPFPPGVAIGFLGYELPSPFHPAPAHARPPGLPDMAFGFYDHLLAFDRARRAAWLACPDPAASRALAADFAHPAAIGTVPRLQWTVEDGRAVHEARVRGALAYIAAGDIYQANVTGRVTAARPAGLDPAALYLRLAAEAAAPFGAFLPAGRDYAIASASPERLVRLSADGRIEARPIKGTRPRGATPATDRALAEALRNSAKDHAENLMIVDLLRHDIGRVADIGSVSVPALCALESFASVHHLVSTVTGRLVPGLGPAEVLAALHPGGSVTGAPKRRAMEIIAELEPRARGPYCGAACWIGFDGTMDSSILIRTLLVGPERVAAHAGGGIVADSRPADEYDEMMIKLRPLLGAFGDAPG